MRLFSILLCCLFTMHVVAQPLGYKDISDQFSPELFTKIREFVLENGSPQTFRDPDNGNPAYAFAALDVFFGPSWFNSFVLKDFEDEDYYEMTIRDNDGSYYQFVCFAQNLSGGIFIQQEMKPATVYWITQAEKKASATVLPLLYQIEDEVIQNSAANNPRPFTDYNWVLTQEFHPMERIYRKTAHSDTLAFVKDRVLINHKEMASLQLNAEKRTMVFVVDKEKTPIALPYLVKGHYYYRYHFNKVGRLLSLVPLDENGDLVCVEGCTQVFAMLPVDDET